MGELELARGSVWRKWDLHIHSPASFHWNGARFDLDPDSPHNIALLDSMINALNASDVQVFALMDYWTFDGWTALKRRLSQPGSPKLTKTVFPGIELRLAAPTQCRLNAHVIFSDHIPEQYLKDFKSALQIELLNKPLSDPALIELVRTCIGDDLLRKVGVTKTEVLQDDMKALVAGCKVAEINCDSYKAALEKVAPGMSVGFMPFDTSDGLAEVRWEEHYAYFLGLFSTSPIFESRKAVLRSAFINETTPENAHFIKNFQDGLKGIPRLVVSGSDAHCFVGVAGDNNKRGYGDFPSGKITWIKADPSFLGLQQAIKEPANRSFIGSRPPKLDEVDNNKTFFINKVTVNKNTPASTADTWLDGCELPLNPDLIAVIGNKGSGKSALADIIALLGNSRQRDHFAFLKPQRFRGKNGEPAKHFKGTLTWCGGPDCTRLLSEDPAPENIELVKYIPQGHFENLCNEHVSGRSNAFELELRTVIFSHTDKNVRLGAMDFEQLVEQQERGFRNRLGEVRKDLRKLNQDIVRAEEQLQPEVKQNLGELLSWKKDQIREHHKVKPLAAVAPSQQLSSEQLAAQARLVEISEALKQLEARTIAESSNRSQVGLKKKAIRDVKDRLRLLERSFEQFRDDSKSDLTVLGLTIDDLATLTISRDQLDRLTSELDEREKELTDESKQDAEKKRVLLDEQQRCSSNLNGPQLVFQAYTMALEAWTAKLDTLTGTVDQPDTLNGLEARIEQLEKLPTTLEEQRTRRLELSKQIFDILEEQRAARGALFKPVQDLIQSNTLVRDEYRLQFLAVLNISTELLADSLFGLVKQTAGALRGADEGPGIIRRLADKHSFQTQGGLLGYVKELYLLLESSSQSAKKAPGIAAILKKEKSAIDVYDLIFGLSFLEPRYTLLFQDARIEQLSPGQRGALLLIFYLLVDKGRTPIILDQPEENLDNQTVVSLLVPVLTTAKQRRQIIMVTHNPNLAVVCDAEQVIYSSFDRKDKYRITYTAGAIENQIINLHVVNVLEGTKRAFENRGSKYH